MGFQVCLLDQISGIDLALKSPADLQASQETKVAPVQFQHLAEGWPTTCTRKAQEQLRVRTLVSAHGSTSPLSQARNECNYRRADSKERPGMGAAWEHETGYQQRGAHQAEE